MNLSKLSITGGEDCKGLEQEFFEQEIMTIGRVFDGMTVSID